MSNRKIMRAGTTTFSLACILIAMLASEASALKKSESVCWQQYVNRYLKFVGPKAMATTAGRKIPRDDTSCGFGESDHSPGAAKAAALSECNKWSRRQGHKEKCRIVHSNP